jgi:hypothetical protein
MVRFILILIVLPAPSAFGQQMSLETDKSSYEYGETIEVRVSVYNDTDSSFTIITDIGSETDIGINDVSFNRVGLPLEVEYEYAPGVKRTWIWKLRPEIHGVPDREGTQVIYGLVGGRFENSENEWPFEKESIVIEAPKYLGGQIEVRFKSEIQETERQALRDSLEVVVIDESGDYQMWQVEGHSIDKLAEEFSDDARFHFFNPHRMLMFADDVIITTSVVTEELPLDFVLHQNYPNPFNPKTIIKFDLPSAVPVRLEIFDVLGRRINLLIDEMLHSGTHEVLWNASNVAGGAYLYRLTAGDFIQTRQMLLVK